MHLVPIETELDKHIEFEHTATIYHFESSVNGGVVELNLESDFLNRAFIVRGRIFAIPIIRIFAQKLLHIAIKVRLASLGLINHLLQANDALLDIFGIGIELLQAHASIFVGCHLGTVFCSGFQILQHLFQIFRLFVQFRRKVIQFLIGHF